VNFLFLMLCFLVLVGFFLDILLQDPPTKCWFEVGDQVAREKIGQTFRTALSQQREGICTIPLLGGPVKKRRKSRKSVKKLPSLMVDEESLSSEHPSSASSSSSSLSHHCHAVRFFESPPLFSSMLDQLSTSKKKDALVASLSSSGWKNCNHWTKKMMVNHADFIF
jgi:hypothetical protein